MRQTIAPFIAALLTLGLLAPPAAATQHLAPPVQAVSTLSEQAEGPALAIGKVTVLRAQQRPLRLTRGVWTTLRVMVENPGSEDVDSVVLTGRGPGLKVRRATVGSVSTRWGTEVELAVRLQGKRKASTLRLVARGGGAAATRTIPVRRVAAVPRAVPGRYRSPDRKVTFRVRNGRLTNLRVTMQMQCGSWPQFTYQTQTWKFPATKIPRSGIIHRWVRVHTSTRQDARLLEIRVAGRKATRARFWLDGGYCTGTKHFRASRFAA